MWLGMHIRGVLVAVGVMVIGGWVHGQHVGTIGIPCVRGIVGDNPSAVKFPASV